MMQPKHPMSTGASGESFLQETRRFYAIEDGLPSNDVRSLATDFNGSLLAVTASGIARFEKEAWRPICHQSAEAVTAWNGKAILLRDGVLVELDGRECARLPEPINEPGAICCMSAADRWFLGSLRGLYEVNGALVVSMDGLHRMLGPDRSIRAIAQRGVAVAVAASAGLFFSADGATWEPLYPQDGRRSWAPRDLRATAFDKQGQLWAASPQGVMRRDLDGNWTLFEGSDGLPYNDFTSMAPAPDGSVWFGLRKGAIRFDGSHWAYRQGLRWLPHDDVRQVLVMSDGDAWLATAAGVGRIVFEPMTWADKARFYEDAIDAHHRRTEHEYVMHVSLNRPGDCSAVIQTDSDNDGLWTGMYGAAQCFAYAATGDPVARQRAKKAFDALVFLGQVTQGGSHPAPPGFVARAILPTCGPDPNRHDSPERDRRRQAEQDKLWKVITPRWPVSADGRWYWKTDTSSDELDGHFFLYALYYDLVAETEEEKTAVRDQVRAVIDHLIDHDFCIVDHDGLPTRWGVFNPSLLNHDPEWFAERGLNSLSMLSYLAVAFHVTGHDNYRVIARNLIDEHGYAQNLLVPKIQNGPGSGNQSDDEMAFMNYYSLIRYEHEPALRAQFAYSLHRYWRLEEPEVNPFFNYAFAACCANEFFENAFGSISLAPPDRALLVESAAELKRFPLDRVDWHHENRHRLDIMPLMPQTHLEGTSGEGKGYRVDGRVLPVDERHFDFWNHDPWMLDSGGDGCTLADGTVFLLPYYMGLYHGFIQDGCSGSIERNSSTI